MFTHDRPGLDLNGTWKFCPDPMQRCRSQQWWRKYPGRNDAFPMWDVDGLWEIQVPGTWKTQFEKLEWYDGHAVYVKEFALAEIPAEHEAFLVFDGVVYEADVYLNGQCVARHEWGYSPFTVRVTECLHAHNRLFVLVDNHHRPDRVPAERYDWNNDGGIINPVKLIFVPRTHIENFRTATRLEGDEVVISVEVMLHSRDDRAQEMVTVRIPELGVAAEIPACHDTPAHAEFRMAREAIELWSPEHPRLYRTELSTRFETIADEIGYREIRRDGTHILLNGEPIRLYGLCVHAEFKDTGRTATPEGIAADDRAREGTGREFPSLRALPLCGGVRAGAGPRRPAVVGRNACLLDAKCGDDCPSTLASGMLEEAVRRDWNRASLIFWSVSNECCYRNPDNPAENNYAYWFHAVLHGAAAGSQPADLLRGGGEYDRRRPDLGSHPG